MKIREFEFNIREFAGSMGDFGTLIPLAIGYIVVCGLNPAGFLIMMGLVNIILGLVYKLPMPLQPKKVIAAVAISQKWSPSLIYSTGFGLGICWLILVSTNLIDKLVKITPKCVTRGIQLCLGTSLALAGFKMIKGEFILAIISVVTIFILRKNRKFPAAIALVLLGVGIMLYKGQLLSSFKVGISLPPIILPNLSKMWLGMTGAGIAQIPLTITNAVIAVASLIKSYFPERAVSEKKLVLNMGIMNIVVPFFGGMPMCHGAGGLAGQYYFGARTGGANIIEGLIEISLGLFLSKSILNLFKAFPMAIVGTMLFLVGIELAKFVKDIKEKKEIFVMLLTAAVGFITNIAIGFVLGLIVFHLFSKFGEKKEII